MKNYKFLLLISLIVFIVSCNDNDDPDPAKLNKLTKVTCYKNDMSTPLYVTNITYVYNGDIAYISNNQEKLTYTYTDNKILAIGLHTEKIEYTLNKGKITEKKISAENKTVNNEVYISDEYKYKYQGNALTTVDWLAQRPTTEGTDYNHKEYKDDQKYKWVNGNITTFSQDKKEMVYEYHSTQLQPSNFPFRVIPSFAPVNFEIVDPTNFLYGYQNNHLPVRAYWYNELEPGTICAEYTYTFDSIGEYITGMRIEEKDFMNDQENTYKFDFQYQHKEE